MIEPSIPANEAARCAALHDLAVLDSEPEERFTRVVRIAKDRFQVPIALVSLVDSKRQWFKAKVGLDAVETGRDISFCGHAIASESDDVFVVEDALADPRFADNPLVAGAPHIRFYAGCPLKLRSGHKVGTLCIIDDKPRKFSTGEQAALEELAVIVCEELERSASLSKAAPRSLLGGWFQFDALRSGLFSRSEAFLLSVAMAVIVLLLALQYDKQANDALTAQTKEGLVSRLSAMRGHLESGLSSRLHLAEGLSGLVHAQPVIDDVVFARFGVQLHAEQSSVRSVQLAEKGIVSHVWPLQGNEAALGHDLLADGKRLAAANAAISSRKMWVDGPLTLLQGGLAIIGRKPIFLPDPDQPDKEKFWGFATVVIDLPELLSEIQLDLVDTQNHYALSRLATDGQSQEVFWGNANIVDTALAQTDINIRGLNWVMSASPLAALDNNAGLSWWGISIFVLGFGAAIFYLLRLPSGLKAAVQRGTEEIRRSQEYLRNALEALGEGFAIFDSQHRLLLCNQRFAELYGVQERDRNRKKDAGAIFDRAVKRGLVSVLDEREDLSAAQWLASRSEQDTPWEVQHSDGRELRVSNREIVGGGVVSVHLDVSDFKEKTKQIEEARVKAELANEAKTTFLATVSHEVRTPLNGVLGLIGVMLDDQSLSEKNQHYLQTAHQSARQLLSILNEILDVSKMEAGHFELEMSGFTLGPLIDSVCSLVKSQAEINGLELDVHSLPITRRLRGDEGRLRQVLLNLLSNAIKFTDHGSVRFELSELSSDESGIRILFQVIDSGVGIQPENIASIFDEFSQVDRRANRRYSGTGLGLAISQRLVKMMGSEITVESSVGVGSNFSFELQLDWDQKQNDFSVSSQEMAVESEEDIDNESTVRVLLAEDTMTNQMVIQAMLEGTAYRLDLAHDGVEAVKAATEFQYEIILMDVYMPNMDGVAATRKIRQITGLEDVPIIALTANAMEGDRDAYLAAGMDDYLPKPLGKPQLLACLAHWRKGRQSAADQQEFKSI